MECDLGLSLATAPETTAYALVQKQWLGTELEAREAGAQDAAWQYTVLDLYRFPTGSSYDQVTRELRQRQDQIGVCAVPMVVDVTGVGQSVLDRMIRCFQTVSVHHVRITALPRVERVDREWQVPKIELVTALQMVLQQKRLKIPKTLDHAELLVEELGRFRVKPKLLSTSPSEEEWRVGRDDDLVFALALVLWWSDRHPKLDHSEPLIYERSIIERMFGPVPTIRNGRFPWES